MATRPAKQPLSVMPRSGLPSKIQAVAVAASVPAAAAVLVVNTMLQIAVGSTAIVLPGLKPNQPSQRIKQPIVAAVIVVAGDGVDLAVGPYLPMRGPRMNTPVRAAQPPTECTTVEPAKSTKPMLASQPPPQIQWPTIG